MNFHQKMIHVWQLQQMDPKMQVSALLEKLKADSEALESRIKQEYEEEKSRLEGRFFITNFSDDLMVLFYIDQVVPGRDGCAGWNTITGRQITFSYSNVSEIRVESFRDGQRFDDLKNDTTEEISKSKFLKAEQSVLNLLKKDWRAPWN